MIRLFLFLILLIVLSESMAQSEFVSKVWVADLNNGFYKNPVLDADYSDPDVCRAGDDYYLTASSFCQLPGLPVLHSKDLVNWKIISHAVKRLPPYDHFDKPQNGNGVWAPAIRYHNNEFYIYYPDPDFGIYLVKAKNAEGPWSDPVLVEGGKGLIDPCPLWDDNGNVFLVHAYAGSRAGIKSVIVVKQLNKEGDHVIDEGKIVYDGHELDPTIEGPKFYKRNDYYYIFAPAGGVPTGWQMVLRSKNIYGPYERKVVMDQGATPINGPHQGAWVTAGTNEDWFLHFQDKEAYGRVVHLQPMKWVNDWPVIGVDKDGDGKGEPVLMYKKPATGASSIHTPLDGDEFDGSQLGRQWQWAANPKATWAFVNPGNGSLRLYSDRVPEDAKNYWTVGNLLTQKFPADEFSVTTKCKFQPNANLENERTGLIVTGLSYAYIALRSSKEGKILVYITCKDAMKGNPENEKLLTKWTGNEIYFRINVTKGAKCRFSYSMDGKAFTDVGEDFQAEPGRWIGAKTGIFCTRTTQTNDSGYADFDWFRVTPN